VKRSGVKAALAVGVAGLVLSGCGLFKTHSDVATVDLVRIMANWPKSENYMNQIQADAFAIETSKAPESQKNRERAELQQRYAQYQREITNDITNAANQVAMQQKFKMVVTRQGIGYGGVDITSDVEKILNIQEKATPSP